MRSFCASWTRPLSALVLNAGVMRTAFTTTESGLEQTFAINHLGNAAFFFGLKAHLLPDARVIFVSSELHSTKAKSGRPHWTTAAEVARASEPEMQAGMTTYANSKLANMLFMFAVSRQAEETEHGKGWTVIAWTPGFVPGGGSQLGRDRGAVATVGAPILRAVLGLTNWLGVTAANMSTVARSGKALADLVTDGQYQGVKGRYYEIDDTQKAEPSEQSQEIGLQDDLWAWTVKELGVEGSL